ncbi:MAG: DUF1837 domain-containing protein [bacterium]|nr:DUF1837 domain-containing protein [bacterium]
MTVSETKLNEALKGAAEGFSSRLRKLDCKWKAEGLTIDGHFYYLAFRNGVPSIDEFVEYIYGQIVPFCIPHAEIEKALSKGHIRHAQKLVDQARHLFVKARESNSKSREGEPGELILYILLEAVLEAPQIACKMYLKTSENMPVHGSDSIHVCLTDCKKGLKLFWGESKLYQSLASAFDDTLASINAFLETKDGRSPRVRDIDILRDHISVKDPKLSKQILDYFDPYVECSNELVEIFACFTGFEAKIFANGTDVKKVEKLFADKYKKRIESACELFAKKVKGQGMEKLSFSLFLIPFENVDEFRKKFYEKIGVTK